MLRMMSSIIYFLVVASFASVSIAFRNYSGHSILRLTPNADLDINILKKLQSFVESDIFNLELLNDNLIPGHASQIRVSPEVKKTFISLLEELNVEHTTTTTNLQKDIDEENDVLRDCTKKFNLNKYHTISEITSYLRDLCRRSKHQCKLISIGKSYLKRNLNVVQIGRDNGRKKVIWIDGGIHAREWISPATTLHLIARFMNNTHYMNKVLDHYVIFVMPNLNPDGYDYTWKRDRLWRKTRKPNRGSKCIGTDANRNWGYKWGGVGSSSNPCSNIYRGRTAFSEPETDAVRRFLARFRSRLALFLSIHSNSQCWLIPFGYTYDVLPKNYNDHVYVAKKASIAQYKATKVHYNVVEAGHLYRLSSGESYDWGKAVAKADYSFIVELRFKDRYGFILPSRYINPTGLEMWAALKAMLNAMQEIEKRGK